MPVIPAPVPVALNITPTVFADAPIVVKLVPPVVTIWYVLPTTNEPPVVFVEVLAVDVAADDAVME